MANQKINGGASPYPKHVGPSAICSFSDGADNAPLKSLSFSIEPKQSGSGDPSPQNIRPITGWTKVDGVAAGKNLAPKSTAGSKATVTYTVADDGTVTSSGTPNGSSCYQLSSVSLKANVQYALSGCASGGGQGKYGLGLYTSDNSSVLATDFGSGATYTPTVDGTFNICIRYWYGQAINGTWKPQVEVGSQPTAYAAPTITPITIALGQTVYGGTVDALAGKAYARPYYSSYSGQALVGPWISSHDKYVSGGTPTTGAQVVDMGGAVTEISVTAQQVSSLLGQNNVWANTGDTELDYYPAQSSMVAVWDRTRHMYVSIPLNYIRYDTYQINPQQAIDLDSYRSETGTLIRNVVGSKCKIEFNTPMMDDSQWAEVWSILNAGFNNTNEKKLKLKYYDTQSGSYKYGYFYVPDVQTPIRSIDEPNGIINYNEIRIAFIEY